MTAREHVIESGEYSRKVWLLEAPERDAESIAVFLDGEYYVNHMDGLEVVHDLQASGRIPPMTSVFVSHVDSPSRHRDLICNEEYSAFIADDVIKWIRNRNPSLPAGGHLIGGTSLGGLAASFLTLKHPETFSRCLSHSGSYWWNDEWLTANLDGFPESTGKHWISVGDYEIQSGISHAPSGIRQDVPQIDACGRFAEALKARRHHVHHSIHPGGHEIRPWKKELPEALLWLLNES